MCNLVILCSQEREVLNEVDELQIKKEINDQFIEEKQALRKHLIDDLIISLENDIKTMK